MGCLKLTYREREGLEKSVVYLGGSLSKKVQSEKKRYNYYPFGMVMAGTAYNDESRTDQLYKFNGNEVLAGNGIPTTLNLMNFNARLYNPALGVFLAVDPQNQFANPYLAFGNNPVLMADSDGEFAFIPFIVTAVFWGAVKGDQVQRRGGNYWEGFTKGFATSAISQSLGSIFQPTNFWGSVLNQTVSGAVSGGITSAISGNSIGDGVKYGALQGAATGVVFGGIDYVSRVVKAREFLKFAGYKPGQNVSMTDSELLQFVENNPELYALFLEGGSPTLVAGRLPNSEQNYKVVGKNSLFEAKTNVVVDGKIVPAISRAGGITYNNSDGISVHIAPARFKKAIKLYMTVGHELHHAKHYYNGAFNAWNGLGKQLGIPKFAIAMSETVAHQWSYNLGRKIYSEAYRNVGIFNDYNDMLPSVYKLRLR